MECVITLFNVGISPPNSLNFGWIESFFMVLECGLFYPTYTYKHSTPMTDPTKRLHDDRPKRDYANRPQRLHRTDLKSGCTWGTLDDISCTLVGYGMGFT